MVGSAPPIYSRLYQEVANGMWGYFQAVRITQVPLPMCVTQMANVLVFVSFVYVPIAVAESVESGIFTPPVTVSISFTVVIIHCITNLIEFPFSDEYMDLPLLEFQCCFNGKLLASPIGFVDESSSDTIFASPERVYRKETNRATTKQKIARHGPQVGQFCAKVIGKDERDPAIVDLERKCEEQAITLETLYKASEMNCLFALLQSLGLPLGYCIEIMQGVDDLDRHYAAGAVAMDDRLNHQSEIII